MELILTHNFSDFDGAAAQLAAALLFRGAVPVLAAQLHDNVAEFIGLHREDLPFVRRQELPDEPITRLILVDTARVAGPIEVPERTPTLIVEHHPFEREREPWEELIYEQVGATTTLLATRLLQGGAQLTPTQATLMLLGIYEDTGGLSFKTTTPADLRCAAALLEAGADLSAVERYLHRPMSDEQQQAYEQIQAALLHREVAGWEGLLAAVDLEGHVDGLATIAHRLRDVYEPALIVLCFGIGESGTQLIARSNSDAVDVSALAEHFGGGGHPSAAAAFVRDRTSAEVLAEVEQVLGQLARPALTAASIMTAPVQTISVDAPMSAAAERLDRTGYSSLPVINEAGKPMGLIGRRELDKAMRHGLNDAAVRTYMWKGITTVAPDAPADELRRIMAEEERGRLLVVEENRLVGLITRGDLLRHTEAPPPAAQGDELSEVLRAALPADRLELLTRAGRQAELRGWGLYLVGGPVRDLILRQPLRDIDLVVEGDAILLARALADELGGEVSAYEQFRTATLKLPSGIKLDFVTARIEFYEHPTALPEVEAASLRHDLHRRDFTINTLALGLTPARFGHLYDFYGGRRDIEREQIRVLHNLSFIDDPTRILRAGRLAARLGFAIEPRTWALIKDALGHEIFARTTPQRLGFEVRRIIDEKSPSDALRLLDELGVLEALHPELRWTAAMHARFELIAQHELPRREAGLLALLYDVSAAERNQFALRYNFAQHQRRLVEDLAVVQIHLPTLSNPTVRASTLDHALHGIDELTLRFVALIEGGTIAEQIERYLHELRPTTTLLNGDDLRQLGIRPGPIYRTLLADLRAAQLDGQIATRESASFWAITRANAEDDDDLDGPHDPTEE